VIGDLLLVHPFRCACKPNPFCRPRFRFRSLIFHLQMARPCVPRRFTALPTPLTEELSGYITILSRGGGRRGSRYTYPPPFPLTLPLPFSSSRLRLYPQRPDVKDNLAGLNPPQSSQSPYSKGFHEFQDKLQPGTYMYNTET
jgi:hypothetical protein